jgi:hypothetical protein
VTGQPGEATRAADPGKTLHSRASRQRERGTVTAPCPHCGASVGLNAGSSVVRHRSAHTGDWCDGAGAYSLSGATVAAVSGDDEVSARRRGVYARTRILPLAQRLVVAVRDEDRAGIGAHLAGLDRQGLAALAVVLAAMVPDDVPAAALLSWITFEDDGTPLPVTRAKPREHIAA